MWNIFKQKRLNFIIISFSDREGLYDYPKELPLPRIGESVLLDGKFGIVHSVRHRTTSFISEVEIQCKKEE